MNRLRVAVALALAGLAPALPAVETRVVAGGDQATIAVPAGAVVLPYENEGYRLLANTDGTVSVEVDYSPIESREPFALGSASGTGPAETLARALVAGAHDRYEASSRLLAWVASSLTYELDRGADQGPEAVLERRTAFCTGYARLAVALLSAVGIEAREVPGYVVAAEAGGPPAGFHRWIEIRFPDRGWVFSDPMANLHFVPATYVRLADDGLAEPPGSGRLIDRLERSEEVDLLSSSLPAWRVLRIRPNAQQRRSAALAVRTDPAVAAEAYLEGKGTRKHLLLPNGRGIFLGLEPGEYELRVEAGGQLAAWKKVTFRNRVLAQIEVPVGADRGEGESRR